VKKQTMELVPSKGEWFEWTELDFWWNNKI